jgi:hypothetical protein
MLQTAVVDKSEQKPRQQISVARTLVAPIKGWFVGSPLAQAPDQTAILLENAFPEIDFVRARGGAAPFATGMPNAPVNTLMPYRAGGGYQMFASCNGSIYDVSNPGAVAAPLVTGLNPNAPFSYISFAASGAPTLMAANGVDPVQLYNGTTWGTAPAITGLTGAPLNYLWTFQSNVWGLQPGSLNAWYLPGSAIGGPISIYPMQPIFSRGGQLIAGGTWTIETTAGLEFANIFITDQGEVAIFAGTTPALSWTLQGVYKIPQPLGPRCLLQAGGDLAVMTAAGILAISQIQTMDEIALQNTAVTNAIQPAWQAAVAARTGLSGWQILEWPLKTMVVVNLPQVPSSVNTQFVANGRTGAWCRYVGWDAQCFEIGGLHLDQLLYGTSDGRVMKGETSGQDDGKTYTMTIFPSFSDMAKTDYGFPSLSQSAGRKQTKMVRPRIQTFGVLSPKVSMKVDYDQSVPMAPPPAPSNPLSGAQWGVAKWGVDVWPGTNVFQQGWLPAQAVGSVISPVIQATFDQLSTPIANLSSIDVLFETGNIFG